MVMWPAALFGLFLGLMATVHLARGPGDITLGLSVSFGLALGVLLISPVFLVPFGFAIVALGWKRDNATLGKRKKRPLWRKTLRGALEPDPGTERLFASLHEGATEAMQPYQRAPSQGQKDAHAFIARVKRTNPFRPEGASGLIPTIAPTPRALHKEEPDA